MDDFDLDQLAGMLFNEGITKSSRCQFKECLQTILYDPFFCPYHSNMVHGTTIKTTNTPTISPPAKKIKKTTILKCASYRCRNDQAPNAYLCNYHDLALDSVQPVLAFQCRVNGCKQLKMYKQRTCINHFKPTPLP